MQPGTVRGDHHSIIGRNRERERLRSLLDTTLTGRGSLVLVSGEAGIGKTTLIEMLAREADEQGALVLTGGCYDLTTTPPYGPWVELLRAHPATDGLPDPPLELRERGGLVQFDSQEQLFHSVADFLSAVAVATPLVLILEDLHWADLASIELLRYLARQLAQQRIVLLASYRDDELTRAHPLFTSLPLLMREARAERLELQPFEAETMSDLVRDRYSLSNDETQLLADYLFQRTEGNPLFAVELLRALERERVLQERNGGWRLGNLDQVISPPLVVQMIERQLATIDPATREALEIAALIGLEISLDLWREVAGLDEETLSAVIEEALVARVIEQYGEMRLRFRHALIRDVLYHAILFAQRRQLHREVAEALVEAGSPDPDSVAYHFQQAGDERALEWLIRAGDYADLAEAHFAAIERYEAALRLLGDDEARLRERGWLLVALGQTGRDIIAHRALAYTEEALRIGKQIGDDALVAWALYLRGENRVLTGQNGLSEMEQGLALLRRVQPSDFPALPSRFGRHYVRDVASNDMASNIIIVQALFGRYRQALANAEEYLARDPLKGELSWVLRGHAEAARATALSALGDAEGSRAAYRQTQDAYQRANVTWYRTLNATTELHYGTLAYRADQLTRRQRDVAEVESIWTQASGMTIQLPPRVGLLPLLVIEGAWTEARELTLPVAGRDVVFYFDFARCALGVIARAQGEPDRAWEQVTTALPDGPETKPGAVWMLYTTDLQRLAADLALDAGDTNLACQWIQAHDDWLEWSERIQGRAEAQLLWARYHRIAGTLETARRHAEQAIECASDPRQPLVLIAALRMLGEIALAEMQFVVAKEHLRQSLSLAEACAAPYEQALTLLALAELGAATGNADEAWRQIGQVRAICTPLGATPSLQRATTIAAKLAVRRGRRVHPTGLSPREVEVLGLVAQGLTDAEVGARLFISPRTVGVHLSSVYNKLGVNSRVAATRFAVEHGLAGSSPA